jgi:hypothetical protein
MHTFIQKSYALFVAAGCTLWMLPMRAQAIFGSEDVNIAELKDGATESSIKSTIVDVLQIVLNFLGFIAVIMVIIAGIRLIISGGDDEQKEKAKKTIFYALIGLIIVLFAKVIVGLVDLI